MRNLKMTIQYDGSRYKGWQRQENTDLTIQGKLENVLSKMSGETIQIIGCGRTDGGVHAENYIANFHTDCESSIKEILDYLYEYLPEDIVVKSIEDVPERFHARYNALSKTYAYRINNNKHRNVFNRKYYYQISEKLNLKLMNDAKKIFEGTHDFKSFTNLKSNKKSTVKTINYININENNNIIEISINGNAFLLNMARIIAGTLIEAGKGNLKVKDIENILRMKNRSDLCPMAQAKGLILKDVQY